MGTPRLEPEDGGPRLPVVVNEALASFATCGSLQLLQASVAQDGSIRVFRLRLWKLAEAPRSAAEAQWL